jgi:hypothetical protein
MKDIIRVLVENDILNIYSAGVYIIEDNKYYRLMVYDANQRIEGEVTEIWDNGKDFIIIGEDISVKYNQFNIFTMVHGDKVIGSSKIVSYFA